MQSQAVKPSHFNSITFDQANHTLEIEFQAGSIYQFKPVPKSVYDGLVKADSKSNYFRDYIRKLYRYRRLR